MGIIAKVTPSHTLGEVIQHFTTGTHFWTERGVLKWVRWTQIHTPGQVVRWYHWT